MELSHSLGDGVIVRNIVAADGLHKLVILSVPELLLGQVSKTSGSACVAFQTVISCEDWLL